MNFFRGQVLVEIQNPKMLVPNTYSHEVQIK
jgi:hypothetical protein